MKDLKLISWNVNGVRAAERKGFLDWLQKSNADIVCLQETKAQKDQLSDKLLIPEGYHSFWSSAEKKGYSGVAVYTKLKPKKISNGFGVDEFDSEGRTLIVEYDSFYLINNYFPNGSKNKERLDYKLRFYDCYLKYVKKLMKKTKAVITCGDVNTAHKEIDLARPKENEKVSGFLSIERAWLDKFIDAGLIDTFREFHKEPDKYSWWDYKTRARERNVGWRIDYFYIDSSSKDILKDAFILDDVPGSDHCPVGIAIRANVVDTVCV